MDNLYICYSVPLMKYLTTIGLKYELVALNKNTQNTFWVYMKSEKLNIALTNWSLGRN